MDWLCRVRSRNDYRDGKNGLIIIFRLENKFDSGETGKRQKERGFGFHHYHHQDCIHYNTLTAFIKLLPSPYRGRLDIRLCGGAASIGAK